MDYMYYERFKKDILSKLDESEFEPGVLSKVDKYYNKLLQDYNKNNMITLLHKFYFEISGDSKKRLQVLQLLSHVEYSDLYLLIILHNLDNKDIEFQEMIIRIIENWSDKDLLGFLKEMNYNEKWLDDYKNAVIQDLKY